MAAALKNYYSFAQYSRGEDLLSCIFHALGILLSIAGTVLLIVFSALYSNAWAIVSSSIFGASMITLYSASTLYHFSTSPADRSVVGLLRVSLPCSRIF